MHTCMLCLAGNLSYFSRVRVTVVGTVCGLQLSVRDGTSQRLNTHLQSNLDATQPDTNAHQKYSSHHVAVFTTWRHAPCFMFFQFSLRSKPTNTPPSTSSLVFAVSYLHSSTTTFYYSSLLMGKNNNIQFFILLVRSDCIERFMIS